MELLVETEVEPGFNFYNLSTLYREEVYKNLYKPDNDIVLENANLAMKIIHNEVVHNLVKLTTVYWISNFYFTRNKDVIINLYNNIYNDIMEFAQGQPVNIIGGIPVRVLVLASFGYGPDIISEIMIKMLSKGQLDADININPDDWNYLIENIGETLYYHSVDHRDWGSTITSNVLLQKVDGWRFDVFNSDIGNYGQYLHNIWMAGELSYEYSDPERDNIISNGYNTSGIMNMIEDMHHPEGTHRNRISSDVEAEKLYLEYLFNTVENLDIKSVQLYGEYYHICYRGNELTKLDDVLIDSLVNKRLLMSMYEPYNKDRLYINQIYYLYKMLNNGWVSTKDELEYYILLLATSDCDHKGALEEFYELKKKKITAKERLTEYDRKVLNFILDNLPSEEADYETQHSIEGLHLQINLLLDDMIPKRSHPVLHLEIYDIGANKLVNVDYNY